MIRILYCGSSSACFELEGSTPYYSNGGYTVLVDGKERLKRDTNVFSLCGLKPGCEYAVTVRFDEGGEERVTLSTKPEACCVNVRDFGAAGDGVHEDTAAIQAAVSFLPEGGRLRFPA
ncbi:MAG: glycoside hydrolase family 28 protein, partial [Subdoligranulum sp.]|nr:glycoside hydrolase family 28 protein [Subdoligranulum sp.]